MRLQYVSPAVVLSHNGTRREQIYDEQYSTNSPSTCKHGGIGPRICGDLLVLVPHPSK